VSNSQGLAEPSEVTAKDWQNLVSNSQGLAEPSEVTAKGWQNLAK
jgi:hypothetical protein